MKRMLLAGVVCVLLAGCDYTVPLVTRPDTDIDAAVIGLWQKSGKDGKTESLLVLPLGKQEYLVAFPAGAKDAMYACGCHWRRAALKLVQLDWFGTAQGKLPDDNRTFQFASYTVVGNTLSVRLLNPDVVTMDVKSADALAQAIADNKDHPKLFRDEMVFQKAKD